MKCLFSLLLFLVSLSSLQASGEHSFYYLTPASVDFKKLLPNPPANDSAETKKEIEILLQRTKACTPEELIAVKNEEKVSFWALFQDVLGEWYKPELLPVSDLFFKNIEKDSKAITSSAKKYWDRPRPIASDSRIKPLLTTPANASYPSGHSTAGTLYALVLADLMPDLKEKLLAKGRLVGEHRIIASVHFPSDVEAGRTLGNEIYKKLCESPSFKADLAKAKAEIIAARKK